MKIIISANTTWYIHNFRSRLILALIGQGHQVTVLAPRDEYVSRIETLGARHLHLEMNNTGTNPLRELLTLASLALLLRRERPALLLTYTPKVNIYVSLVACLLNIPVIANVSGLGSGFMRNGLLKVIMRGLYRLALRHPFMVFFQNEDDLTEFVRSGLVTCARTARLPGSGVDLERFTPAQRTKSKRVVFLMVARLLWEKGVGEFVEAARRLKMGYPEAEFRLLGFLDVQNPSAVPRSCVENWMAEGVITYLGSTDDVLPYYTDADCVVLPSYYREGVPRTLLEAASTGLPVITTDSAGCRDVVDHGITGFLCKTRDVMDLADKMECLILLTPEQRAEMGKAGRAKMELEFDERIVIEMYLEVIGEIMLKV